MEVQCSIGEEGDGIVGSPEGWKITETPPSFTGYITKEDATQYEELKIWNHGHIMNFSQRKLKKEEVTYQGYFMPCGATIPTTNENMRRFQGDYEFLMMGGMKLRNT